MRRDGETGGFTQTKHQNVCLLPSGSFRRSPFLIHLRCSPNNELNLAEILDTAQFDVGICELALMWSGPELFVSRSKSNRYNASGRLTRLVANDDADSARAEGGSYCGYMD